MPGKILIISPHFPPSNLAAVHRSRLFAQHLPAFGWEPIILMVDEKYYEEKPDWNLVKLLPSTLRMEKVTAYTVTKPRLVGDIGLRAFFQLYKKAKKLIKEEQISFLYIPIPSFYVALLGRWLHQSTGIKYGIDYIDPWVHHFPGSDRMFSRHWFSTQLAKLLEPVAVKKAAVITGVAEGYYKGVIERNPQLQSTCLFGAMPYGGEASDHKAVKQLGLKPYLFQKDESKLQLVYAGAFLPKSVETIKKIFEVIAENKGFFDNTVFHFIGTGRVANDANSHTIKPIAEEYGLYGSVIKEYPARIPYLDVLVHLEAADGIFVLGSTEPHYTPSKVYQGVLSQKPILAVLHNASTAAEVVSSTNAGIVLGFNGEEGLVDIKAHFKNIFEQYQDFQKIFEPSNAKVELFDQFSARNVTAKLVQLLNKINDR